MRGSLIAASLILTVCAFLKSEPLSMAANLAYGKTGVMDASGVWIVPPRYGSVKMAGPSLYQAQEAVAKTKFSALRLDSQIYLFDLKGRPVSFAAAKNGRIISVISQSGPLRFSFGGGRELEGVLDDSGKTLVEPIYAQILSAGDGYYVVRNSAEETFSVLDASGKVLSKINGSSFWPSPDGFCQGVLLCTTAAHASSYPVFDGTAPAFLRPDGSSLKMPPLQKASSFSCGLAAVVFSGDGADNVQSGFVKLNGDVLADKKFDFCQSFQYGRAIVGVRDKITNTILKGVINPEGDFVIAPIWLDLRNNTPDSYIARSNSDDGTAGGEIIIDARGAVISHFNRPLQIKAGEASPQMAYCLDKVGLINEPGQLVAVDKNGNIFDRKHWPDIDVVAPVADSAATGRVAALAGLRNGRGWVTKPTCHFLEALPGGRWVVEAVSDLDMKLIPVPKIKKAPVPRAAAKLSRH